jgi:hypothetical protein
MSNPFPVKSPLGFTPKKTGFALRVFLGFDDGWSRWSPGLLVIAATILFDDLHMSRNASKKLITLW